MFNKGCIACAHSTCCLFSKIGLMPFIRTPNNAFARMKSISPIKLYEWERSDKCGRIRSVNSIRIFTTSRRSSASNSRSRLLASATASGSINTVFPLPEPSCTRPLIFRLLAASTGITICPSRKLILASFPNKPAFWASRIAFCILRDTAFVASILFLRISAS